MEIKIIFEPNLYSIAYDKNETYASIEDLSEYIEEEEFLDELTKALELWTNPEYLEQFFHKNQKHLQSEYWGAISIEEAISKTIELAHALEEFLVETKADNVEYYFNPLDNLTTRLRPLGKSKFKDNWLRLYAIKIDDNRFLITGGAIKLTRTMQENEYTNNELYKLSKVCNFLKQEGVFDSDSFDELLFEVTL